MIEKIIAFFFFAPSFFLVLIKKATETTVFSLKPRGLIRKRKKRQIYSLFLPLPDPSRFSFLSVFLFSFPPPISSPFVFHRSKNLTQEANEQWSFSPARSKFFKLFLLSIPSLKFSFDFPSFPLLRLPFHPSIICSFFATSLPSLPYLFPSIITSDSLLLVS